MKLISGDFDREIGFFTRFSQKSTAMYNIHALTDLTGQNGLTTEKKLFSNIILPA